MSDTPFRASPYGIYAPPLRNGILSKHYRILDLSFNLLRSVPEVFLSLHSLDTVYFVQNKITTISNLQNLTSLRSLELGGNRIRVSERTFTQARRMSSRS
jgi:Leucine-rich repeat (LRR) protein